MQHNSPNTALMVMDMQTAILKNYPDQATILNNVGKAIAHARKSNIPVIYVRVGFREGGPEISKNNKLFSASKERFTAGGADEFLKLAPSIIPAEGEVVVTKRRISAFTGSDLEVVLRSFGIEHLVLMGVSTSGVVLSTVREAADKDYRISVLSDCCGDADPEVHRVLTTKVFPRQAEVLTVEEWCK